MRIRTVVRCLAVVVLLIPYALVMFPIWAARDLFGPAARIARRIGR